MTNRVAAVNDFGDRCACAEAAASVLSELPEVCAPNFDSRVSIFGTVPRVEGIDARWLVVSVLHTVSLEVGEVASETNSESYREIFFFDFVSVITLEAGMRSVIVMCFSSLVRKLVIGARDICSSIDVIVVAKTALNLR